MGNARLFFNIEKRIKKIRWERGKGEERERGKEDRIEIKKLPGYTTGSFSYVHMNLRFR